ncbi:MAG TPA: hypothetical protein VGG83_28125 [Trebonia sp.]
MSLSHAMYEQFWDNMHKAYTTLVVPLLLVNLDQSPELRAVDLYPGGRRSEEYEPTWHQLAAVLGTPVPWFHYALRDKTTITDWKPNDPPAIIPAQDAGLRTGPLLELAADEPDGSPAAAVCLWLARHLRRLDTAAAQRDISEIRPAAKDPNSDCAYVRIAAVPALVARPADDEPGEMTRRAGWAQITERRDALAEAVAQVVLQWDGGRSWPAADVAQFDPVSSPAAAEWTERLRPAPVGQPPTVLERRLLEHIGSTDHGVLLYDDASGCSAVRRTDHLGKVTVFASVAQRISTVAPLSAVTLGGHTVWVHTEDGGIWLAPELPGHGLSWGYSGGGPVALAELLGNLLDDITSPAVSRKTEPDDGLYSLVENTPKDSVTTYSRAQLLAAARDESPLAVPPRYGGSPERHQRHGMEHLAVASRAIAPDRAGLRDDSVRLCGPIRKGTEHSSERSAPSPAAWTAMESSHAPGLPQPRPAARLQGPPAGRPGAPGSTDSSACSPGLRFPIRSRRASADPAGEPRPPGK